MSTKKLRSEMAVLDRQYESRREALEMKGLRQSLRVAYLYMDRKKTNN